MRVSKTPEPSVLLIDRDPLKQQLRAIVFRKSEIDVQTAGSLTDAVRLCRTYRYDMVLLAGDPDSQEASLICSELWKVAPRQRIAQLVGPPRYLREMGSGQGRPRYRQTPSVPKLRLVEPLPQRTHWSALMDRLLAAG